MPPEPSPRSGPRELPDSDPLDSDGAQLRIVARQRLYAPMAVMQAIHPGASTVDDNRHHRIPLLRTLRAPGHNVLCAANGAPAIPFASVAARK